MARHCEVTGLPKSQCDCGCDEQDDEPAEGEPWRDIPFRPPEAPDDED